MPWNLKKDRPIYLQLIDTVVRRIVAGDYPPGSKLAGVRELAVEAGVNPNTMQKALSDMEETGLICSQRTTGRFVTEDIEAIQNMRLKLARELAKEFLGEMKFLRVTQPELIGLLEGIPGLEET